MSRVPNYVQGKRVRKTFHLMVSLLPVVVFIAFPLSANAQTMEVSPTYHNFGSVELDTSPTTLITVQNIGEFFLSVDPVYITGDTEFEISDCPTLPAIISPPDGVIHSISVEVTFTPTGVEDFSGTLVVVSDNGTVTVTLEGTGVPVEPPPSGSVAEILAFFDEYVANGTLPGDGPGNSADGRRNALRNMIEAAGDLIDDGYIAEACEQLLNAYERCDGLVRPPDFVAGDAAPVLAGMILDLMGELGCE